MVNWLARYLPTKHIELSVGDFEVGCGIFVLSDTFDQ